MNITARSNGKLKRKKPFKVLVCLVTLMAFLYNTVLFDVAWAVGTPSGLPGGGPDRADGSGLFKKLHADTFTLPQYLGHVKDAFKGDSGKVIIHIQDAHCNYAAQHKIADIIEYLHNEYGIDTINLEGGKGEYDLSIFTRIYDKGIREKVADYFVKEGLVNGAEYFAINNPEKAELWGVEDTELYLKNLNVYRELLKHKNTIEKYLKELDHIISNLKRHIYNPKLLELDQKYTEYKTEKLEFKDYLTYLIQKAQSKAIDIKSLTNIYLLHQSLNQENDIDFKVANNERNSLIGLFEKMFSKKAIEELIQKTVEFKAEQISQKDYYAYLVKKANQMNLGLKDYPELQKYIAYISTYEAIDKAKVMEELTVLETKLKEFIFENDDQKTLDTLSKNLVLTKNIFNISISRDDWEYYKKNEKSFDIQNYTGFIDKKAPVYKITAKLDNNIDTLDRYRKNISEFYDYSFKRDKVFLNNIKPANTALLVTGGFHTENLCELFKKKDISYISIMPNFKNGNGYESPYFTLLKGEMRKIGKAVHSVLSAPSSVMATAALSTVLGKEIWGERNIDEFKLWEALAEISFKESWDINRVDIHSFSKKGDKLEFTIGGETKSVKIAHLLHQAGEIIDEGMADFSDIDVMDISRVRAIELARNLGIDVQEGIDNLTRSVDREGHKLHIQEVTGLPDGQNEHAGGYGISIRQGLSGDEKTEAILHGIIAGFVEDHTAVDKITKALLDNKLNEAQSVFNNASKHTANNRIAALWDMSTEQRKSIADRRDFATKKQWGVPERAVYAVEQGESYDDIVLKELAKQKGVSVDDLEADFERTVTMLEERIQYSGFIQPNTDIAAQKIHDIFDRLIKVYQTQTQESPGNFHVVDANTVNAFVIRKRTDVYFYKGLYEALCDISKRMNVPLTEDMIAFIIAHELSHALQHTSHQGLDIRDLNESVSPYLIQMIKNGEYDADMRALELMDKAGYSVFGAVDAMTFLEFINNSSQAENVLSSHPYVSLRKHRLSQIIFDQKTNVFTNVKAPRTPMVGDGRMKSQDVDFRHLMDKTEQDLQTMAQGAENITALDELTGMLVIRKRMNALKALVNENYLKTSFLQHVYMQAVLAAFVGRTGVGVMPDSVDYSDMKGAAAIYDFGIPATTGSITRKPTEEFKDRVKDMIKKIRESLSYHTTDDVVAARDLLESLLSSAHSVAGSLSYRDFDSFLLSPEDVKDIIPLFTKKVHGVSISEREETQRPDRYQISSAINDPRRLISAFFYANYLSQEPSTEFGIPTTEIRVKLQRRKNEVYLENPAYRDTQSVESRKKLRDIVLLHYALARTRTNLFSDHLDYSFPGIDKLLEASPDMASNFFTKYYKLLSEKYPKPIAIRLAVKRMRAYLGVDIESIKGIDSVSQILNGADTLQGFFNEIYGLRKQTKSEYKGDLSGWEAYIKARAIPFMNSHPLIISVRNDIQKYADRLSKKTIKEFEEGISELGGEEPSYDTNDKISNILTALANIYSQEPMRGVSASEVFTSETKLDYYIKEGEIRSFNSLLALPDWAVSDYLNRKKYEANNLIQEALKEGVSIVDIFMFMRTRLGYDDRRKVFEGLFLGYGSKPIYLFNFFKTLNNNPQEIIVWFLGMFSKKDALELIDKFCREALYKKAKDTENKDEAAEFKKLTITLFEYIYSQTSKTFHADGESAKVYLDLINDRINESGKAGDDNYVRETVYNALMILSASSTLGIEFSCPKEVSKDGPADFKTEKTNLVPAKFDGEYADYESDFTLHNFGWNDKKSSSQSVFVTYLVELSIEQLKQLLAQRLKYVESRADIEYRGEVFSLSGLDDFFANLATLIMLKKMHNPNWMSKKNSLDKLNDLIGVSVLYAKEKKQIKVTTPRQKLKINEREINSVPYRAVKDNLIGTAIPSGTLDPVWGKYVRDNDLYDNFPELVPLLQNPNVGNECIYNPLRFLKRHRWSGKVPYRQVVKKFFMDSSVYATLFNAYCKLHGKGYVYGKYRPLRERLEWVRTVLPHKSIIKDSIIDLWETDIFPEIIADLPALVQLARKASEEGEELRDMWTLLGEMDDDVSRLKRLNDEIGLSPERIQQLLAFYEAIIPLALSPQKIARYGATSYMLWKQLPGNADLGLSEHLDALTKFMPEPSVLRDEVLMRIANKYARHLEDASRVCEKLYSNNLLSRNRDLRTEDFVSETLLHLFGGAKIEDRRDVLLWLVGACDKPHFVVDVEEKYRIDFTTLPADVKLLPASMREKFIEGFMLGDNGVLDPQNDSDRQIMSDFLERLFLYIFPEGTKGIGNEERNLISKIFLVVMKSFPPYRRVQVIKALAALRVRADFEKTSTGERFSVLLGVMGPVGIKVAQYLSENETLVPDDSMRSSLGALRHRAPEITKISACAALENEVPLSEVLVREIGKPVGVASIKQVNRGKWLDIKTLAELIIRKASRADANEVKEKVRAHHAKEIATSEVVAYIVEKARHYKIDLEEATVSVVFKIRRPNIDTTLGVDFAALDAVAKDLEGTSHKGEAINISDLVQTVKEWVTLEKNFRNEVKFHNMLTELDYSWAEDLEKEADVTIAHPRILYATDSLIVEQEIQGALVLSLAQRQQPITIEDVIDAGYSRTEADGVFNRLTALEPRQAHITLSLKKAGFAERDLGGLTRKMLAYDYTRLRELLRHMLLRQIFIDGVFHADLHQGNILVTPEGKIVMIDRGNVGTLNKEQIEGAKVLLRGLSLREKESIKQGIDLMFLHAQYPDGVQPVSSRITLDDIQEVLDKGYDLKMTMNMISMRAVQGAKNTPGGKDFSTFLKAFTQAMYLFPTDLQSGMATLQVIAQYISMSEDEARRAAQEQAKYFVVKDISAEAGEAQPREGDIMQIARRLFYERTNRFFLRSVWRPVIFRIMAIPLKIALSKASSLRSNMMTLVRVYGRQVMEEHISEFVERQDSEIGDVVKDIISVQYAEKFLTEYVERSMKERFWGRLFSPIGMPLFRGFLFVARPFTRIFVDATREWISGTGKRYIVSSAPQMTVREGVELLSQVFGEDFGDIKKKLDEGRERTQPEVAPPAPPTQMKELGKRTPMDEDRELDLRYRHEKFEKLAENTNEQEIDAATASEPNLKIQTKVIYADLGKGQDSRIKQHVGGYHFVSGKGELIIVLNERNRNTPSVGEEAMYHEAREYIWLKRSLDGIPVTQHQAHIIASAEGVAKFSNNYTSLTPYHEFQLSLMTTKEKENIISESEESRGEQHDALDVANKLGARIAVDEIKKYENMLRSIITTPISVAAPKKESEIRQTTNVESLHSDPIPGRVVRIVVGQAKVDRDTKGHAIGDGRTYEKTAMGISKGLSDNRFGVLEYDSTTGKTVMDERKQVLTFDMETADQYQKHASDSDRAQARQGAINAFIASVRNALQGLPQGGSVVAYVPQVADGIQLVEIKNGRLIIASEIQEAFRSELESHQLIMFPDAYSDLNPENEQYPDYDGRVALGRHVTAYYRGDNTSLDRIRTQLQRLGENPDDILSIGKDGILLFLRALRIKAIDYESIRQWQISQEAVATAL